jgi:hypothetical protein
MLAVAVALTACSTPRDASTPVTFADAELRVGAATVELARFEPPMFASLQVAPQAWSGSDPINLVFQADDVGPPYVIGVKQLDAAPVDADAQSVRAEGFAANGYDNFAVRDLQTTTSPRNCVVEVRTGQREGAPKPENVAVVVAWGGDIPPVALLMVGYATAGPDVMDPFTADVVDDLCR